MRFLHARLHAAAACLDEQRAFYAGTLALPTRPDGDGLTVTVGETELAFDPAPSGAPFYHFALLVPGDRFDAALTWIIERVDLLGRRERPEVVFDFPAWSAHACYFHDPAGNIVELIAHRDRDTTGARGPFAADELLGLSELGLVGRPTEMAPALAALGLEVWDGRVADDDALAFVGVQARTLILVPEGRGWLPTGRPAELHPVRAVLSGETRGEVQLAGGRYQISRRPPSI